MRTGYESTDVYGANVFRGRTVKLATFPQLAREGLHAVDWYDRAAVSVASYAALHGHTVRYVADVIGILSPRVHVSRNVTMADQYLRGLPVQGAMGPRIAALAHYERSGDMAKGPALKIRAFSAALQGDPDAVVIDVWMVRAAGQPGSVTPKRYRALAARIRATATRMGISPAGCQAAIWTGIRARAGYTDAGDLVMPQ